MQENYKKEIDRKMGFMRKFLIFEHLSRNHIQKLSYFLKESHFQKGHVLFKRGDPVDGVYLIQSGEFEESTSYTTDFD